VGRLRSGVRASASFKIFSKRVSSGGDISRGRYLVESAEGAYSSAVYMYTVYSRYFIF